jgi:2TM domain
VESSERGEATGPKALSTRRDTSGTCPEPRDVEGDKMTSTNEPEILVPRTDEERREVAIKHLKAKNDFKVNLVAYLAVNTFLIVVWAILDRGTLFWPVFPLVGWGIAVVINGYKVYRRNPFTEDRIEREVDHLSR